MTLRPWHLVAVIAVVAVLPNALVLKGPAGTVEREWRHYVTLRAGDRARPAPHRDPPDFARVVEINRPEGPVRFADELLPGLDRLDAFGHGDALLIRGRLLRDRASVCASIPFFAESLEEAPDDFARAIVYETLFAVGRECGSPRPADLERAIALWKRMGVEWRAGYEERLLAGETLDVAGEPAAVDRIPPVPTPAGRVTFGASQITLAPTMLVAGQAERVSRNWLDRRLRAPWKLDPEIDYFEGATVNAVARSGAARTAALYGTIVKKIGTHWYAPDDNGRFTFLVLRDKVEQYPTTRFLADDFAVVIDVHGASALVALAIQRQADVVVACCDYFDKARAAVYLAERGIAVVCAADRFLGYAIGHRGRAAILGGALLHTREDAAVLGGTPLTMAVHEPIVVETTDEPYPLQYYDAPARYFTLLHRQARVAFNAAFVDRRPDLAHLLQVARTRSADIVAVRVETEDDYGALRTWLDESPSHRVLLFHSTPYAPGRRIAEEYPARVTIPDASPQLEERN